MLSGSRPSTRSMDFFFIYQSLRDDDDLIINHRLMTSDQASFPPIICFQF
ncbi:hypothetical protein F383_18898 [Gossypium arboreum]|uniref:Uncharacterized protein n=1 Tax=Gossypium arboreum TaxID=29729 RepID=A0A0B0NQM4_GOSAR|nr:hypothetical protein F383_18898 [Gossypium arboreum]